MTSPDVASVTRPKPVIATAEADEMCPMCREQAVGSYYFHNHHIVCCEDCLKDLEACNTSNHKHKHECPMCRATFANGDKRTATLQERPITPADACQTCRGQTAIPLYNDIGRDENAKTVACPECNNGGQLPCSPVPRATEVRAHYDVEEDWRNRHMQVSQVLRAVWHNTKDRLTQDALKVQLQAIRSRPMNPSAGYAIEILEAFSRDPDVLRRIENGSLRGLTASITAGILRELAYERTKEMPDVEVVEDGNTVRLVRMLPGWAAFRDAVEGRFRYRHADGRVQDERPLGEDITDEVLNTPEDARLYQEAPEPPRNDSLIYCIVAIVIVGLAWLALITYICRRRAQFKKQAAKRQADAEWNAQLQAQIDAGVVLDSDAQAQKDGPQGGDVILSIENSQSIHLEPAEEPYPELRVPKHMVERKLDLKKFGTY